MKQRLNITLKSDLQRSVLSTTIIGLEDDVQAYTVVNGSDSVVIPFDL